MAVSEEVAFVALTRFGLGPRAGELGDVGTDPRGYVAAQLGRPAAALINDPDLKPSNEALIFFDDANVARKAALEAGGFDKSDLEEAKAAIAAENGMEAGGGMEGGGMEAGGGMQRKLKQLEAKLGLPKKGGFYANQMFRNEVEARYRKAAGTGDAMLERLVVFWSNHFCVSTAKNGLIRSVAGPYEREAIRPHVVGRFRDMLGAAVKHPAMLMYLDNWRSIGPNSVVGRRRDRGLNENLGREVLELHTLGVDGGYTQQDVTNFAFVLTGWTLNNKRPPRGVTRFEPQAHEPGPQTILGKTYPDVGAEQLDLVLDDLARNPATARHIARKLVRYFVADAAPPQLVEAVATAFRDSDGDLAVTVGALVNSDAAWTPPLVKMRSPYEFTVASIRATGVPVPRVFNAVQDLGQKIWAVPSPAGFPTSDDAWLGGDALLERIDWAASFAQHAAGTGSVAELGTSVLGAALDEDTLRTVQRAESNEQALTLLIMSPVFQRR